jgi:lipoprotein-anchoring transpeptidase ErfK/SrfK
MVTRRSALLVAVAFLAIPAGRAAALSADDVNAVDIRDIDARPGDAGPAVARLQIALDRALASPGEIDGRFGRNTALAIRAFQEREGLEATGELDRRTLRKLARRAGRGPAVVEHELTARDLEGPFVKIPSDVYEQAEMDCLCYRSLAEKLGERFHASPAFLRKLNPDVDLGALSPGDRLLVPAIREPEAGDDAEVARVVVHKAGGYLRALDADGETLFHFPVTVGGDFTQSPDGTLEVEAIAEWPTWHYRPRPSEDPPAPDAYLPPGPNNPVGLVWIALSKPSYGIHGTNAPGAIGYASSRGCVRLTNWDAMFLASRLEEGTPVEFVE